jgi:hypothetical protein
VATTSVRQTVTFALKWDDHICNTLDITVRSHYNFTVFEVEDYVGAIKMVREKYHSLMYPSYIHSVNYDPDLGDGAYCTNYPLGALDKVYIGPDRMRRSENWTIYTIGHENVHGGQSYWIRGLAEVSDYWHAVIELEATQWGLDNADELGLSQAERDLLQTSADWYQSVIDQGQ